MKDENRTNEKKSKKGKVLIIILAVVLVLAASVAGVAGHYLNKINRVEEDVTVAPENEEFETDEDNGGEKIDPEDVEWQKVDPLGDDKLLNILLVGQDRRPGQGRQRSDTMIICSVNTETKEVALISFLRDLYVQIPGYSDNRLNAAYVFGGFKLLKETLYENFGVSVDGCFEVDFDGFRKVIDIVGGVDINLTAAEAKVIGGGAKAGMNHLNGKNALEYARIRKIDSDFNRTKRQRNVIMAAFKEIRNCSLAEFNAMLNEALPSVTTDLSNSQITSLVLQLSPIVSGLKLKSYNVPTAGNYKNAMIRGMAVLVPDRKAIRGLLKNKYLPLS